MTLSVTRRALAMVAVVCALPLFGAISYGPATLVPTGNGSAAAAVADFNGDCLPDFATANFAVSNVVIRFGNGAGGFPTSSTLTGFVSPESIVAGDFNGDGKADLAVANTAAGSFGTPGSNTIAILLGDGAGNFAAQPSLTTGFLPANLITGDFNEDGALDIISVDRGSMQLSLFLGNGNGTFSGPSHPATGAGGATGPAAVVAADLNGDGHLDLATANGDSVSILLGDGMGGFGAPSLIPYPSGPDGADQAINIAAGDLDNDGDIDLATVAGNVVGGATILRNNGAGTFTHLANFSMPQAPANPVFVKLADLDGDGKLDIITANQNGCPPWGSNLSARPGNGDTTFGAAVAISVGYTNCIESQYNPLSFALADLNCDGKLDIIAPDDNRDFASVMLTPGAADNTPPVVSAPPNVTVSGSGASCSATVSDATLGHATATDDCHCVTITRSGVPAGNIFPVGTTIVTFTATDSVPPSIGPFSPITATAGAGCVANLTIATPAATDNCGPATVNGVRGDAQPLSAPYPIGTTTITWTATDSGLNTATATQDVIVSAPLPVITGESASPSSLWPPNHKMKDVTVTYSTTGGCGSVDCTISSISSNEPVNGLGDGDTAPDGQLVDAHHVKLRAERGGNGTGRIYTITITCTDSGGHTTSKNVTVTVPQ
jgi:hypothetical protein